MAQTLNNQQSEQDAQDACYCLPIAEAEWEEKDLNWTGKQFFRVSYRSWLYTPREDISQKILQAYQEIAKRGYGLIPYGLNLYKIGLFRSELLLEIKKGEVDDPDIKTFMGEVHTKIYIGPVADLPAVAKTFNFKPLNIYRGYFSCPVCAPDPNLQKTVLFGEKNYY